MRAGPAWLQPSVTRDRPKQWARGMHAPQEISKYDSGSTSFPLLLRSTWQGERPVYTTGAQVDIIKRARELQIPECHGVRLFCSPQARSGGDAEFCRPCPGSPEKTQVQISAVPKYGTHNPHVINSSNPTPRYNLVKATQLT